jgi:hypothetical protein
MALAIGNVADTATYAFPATVVPIVVTQQNDAESALETAGGHPNRR